MTSDIMDIHNRLHLFIFCGLYTLSLLQKLHFYPKSKFTESSPPRTNQKFKTNHNAFNNNMNHPPNDDGGTPPDLPSRIMTHHQFRREMNRIRRLNRRRRPFYRVAAEDTVRYIKRFNWKSGLGFTLIGCGTVYGGYWIFCLDGGSTIVTAAGAIGGYLAMQSPMQPFNEIDPMNGLDIDVHHVGRQLQSKASSNGSTTYTCNVDEKENTKALQKLFNNRIYSVKVEDELGLCRAIANIDNNWNGKSALNEAEETKAAQDIQKLIQNTLAQNPDITTNWREINLFPLSAAVAYAKATESNIMLYLQDYTGSVVGFNKIYIVGGKRDLEHGSEVRFLLASITNSNSNGINVQWNWISSDRDADPEKANQKILKKLPKVMLQDLSYINGNIQAAAKQRYDRRNEPHAVNHDVEVFARNEDPLTFNKPLPKKVSNASMAPQSVQGPPTGSGRDSGSTDAGPQQQNPTPPTRQDPPRLVQMAQRGAGTSTKHNAQNDPKPEPKNTSSKLKANPNPPPSRPLNEKKEIKIESSAPAVQQQHSSGDAGPPPNGPNPEPKTNASQPPLVVVHHAPISPPQAQRHDARTQSSEAGQREGQRPPAPAHKAQLQSLRDSQGNGGPPPDRKSKSISGAPPQSKPKQRPGGLSKMAVIAIILLLCGVPAACICIGLMIFIFVVQRRQANSAAMNHDAGEPPVADMV